MKISFGGLTLDTETRQLLKRSAEVHLSPKAFHLLALIVGGRPRAFSKAELLEQLWPGTYVSESNLAGIVAEIRRALRDDARTPRFLRTVQRFGYAFVGEATDVQTASSRVSADTGYWLVWGKEQIALAEGDNILGRGPDAGMCFDSVTVSRRHARIRITGRKALLEDLGSKNGTCLGGDRVTASRTLADGDEISLGSFVVTFRVSSSGRSTVTQRS